MGEMEPEIREEAVFEVDRDIQVPDVSVEGADEEEEGKEGMEEDEGETGRARKIRKQTAPKEPKPKKVRSFLDENGNFKTRFREFEVIVRNCPFEATQTVLREHFQSIPKLKSLKLCHRGDGKFNGNVFVKLGNEESLEAAMALNGSKLLGRTIYVDKTQATIESEAEVGKKKGTEAPPSHSDANNPGVFVANFGEASEEVLREVFGQFGPVVSVRVVGNMDQPFRRFAFIDFESGTAAREAINAVGLRVGDRPVKVRPAFQKETQKPTTLTAGCVSRESLEPQTGRAPCEKASQELNTEVSLPTGSSDSWAKEEVKTVSPGALDGPTEVPSCPSLPVSQ